MFLVLLGLVVFRRRCRRAVRGRRVALSVFVVRRAPPRHRRTGRDGGALVCSALLYSSVILPPPFKPDDHSGARDPVAVLLLNGGGSYAFKGVPITFLVLGWALTRGGANKGARKGALPADHGVEKLCTDTLCASRGGAKGVDVCEEEGRAGFQVNVVDRRLDANRLVSAHGLARRRTTALDLLSNAVAASSIPSASASTPYFSCSSFAPPRRQRRRDTSPAAIPLQYLVAFPCFRAEGERDTATTLPLSTARASRPLGDTLAVLSCRCSPRRTSRERARENENVRSWLPSRSPHRRDPRAHTPSIDRALSSSGVSRARIREQPRARLRKREGKSEWERESVCVRLPRAACPRRCSSRRSSETTQTKNTRRGHGHSGALGRAAARGILEPPGRTQDQ